MDLFQNTSFKEYRNMAAGKALIVALNFYKKECLPEFLSSLHKIKNIYQSRLYQ